MCIIGQQGVKRRNHNKKTAMISTTWTQISPMM